MKTSNVRRLDWLRMHVRSLFRRNEAEQEMDAELAFHFDSVVEGYIAQGLAPADARRKARLEIGGVEQIKEECREARGLAILETLLRDIGYAWRGLRREPGFTLAAAGAIALGVGANTALFTLIYGLVYRPVPVTDPASLRNIYVETRGDGLRNQYGSRYFVSYAEFTMMREHARTAELAAVSEAVLSRKGGQGRPVHAQFVSANLLPLIGGRPALGRFFSDAETARAGAAPLVVLSTAAWRAWFGAASDVVGRQMILNRTLLTVTGVADPSTTGPLLIKPEVWIPVTMQAVLQPSESLLQDPNTGWLQVIARRKIGVTDRALTAEMQVLASQSVTAHQAKLTAHATVARAAFLNSPEVMTKGALAGVVLFLAVSLVLLVACSNVANMMLARALSRRHEIAIRLSIGAGKGRLLQQLLTESLMLSVFGGAIALALAQVAGRLVVACIPADVGQQQLDVTPDGHILLYTLAVSLLSGIVFGMLPALNLLRSNLTPALKSQGLDFSSGRRGFRLQDALVGLQVCGCLVLLVSAGLLLRGFRAALHMDFGQSVHNILLASADLQQQQYTPAQAARFWKALGERAAVLPGARAASVTGNAPFLSECVNQTRVLGRDGRPGQPIQTACDWVGVDYFKTMNIARLRGRPFEPTDLQGRPQSAIVDQQFAQRYFAGANPVGRRIRVGDRPEDDREIIGVVADTKGLRGDADVYPRVYQPMSGDAALRAVLVMAYSGPRRPLVGGLEKSGAAVDPNITLTVSPIEDNVNIALLPQRLAVAAASTLGGLGLLLACTGVYGVVAFAVGRRRREIGIRVALGAARNHILCLVLWQGFKPVLTGAAIGLALSVVFAQLIRAMLYGISPVDPVAFFSTAFILCVVALAAALVPARSALRVDPAQTLRHD